jgi:carbamate kinase
MSAEGPIVVALGGNAILRRGDDGTITTQFGRASTVMRHIAQLAAEGDGLVLTHGNGPVVGNIVLRGEAARATIAPMPLYIAGADSEGGIGFMLQTALRNELTAARVPRDVSVLVTTCVVDAEDPAFASPTKPIGPYFDGPSATELEAEEGWEFREEPGRGWRRVVPSPLPSRILEVPAIAALASTGSIVIAAGGGGVPVIENPDGSLAAIDAVIDKDWASALLASDLESPKLVILMEAERVCLGFGTPDERPLDRLTCDEADELLAAGAFAAGSMAPKIAASSWFVRTTGAEAIICSTDSLVLSLAGAAGTHITRA